MNPTDSLLEALYQLIVFPPTLALELPFFAAYEACGIPAVGAACMALAANLIAIPLHNRMRGIRRVPALAADVLWLGLSFAWLATQLMTQFMFPEGLLIFALVTAAFGGVRWARSKQRQRMQSAKHGASFANAHSRTKSAPRAKARPANPHPSWAPHAACCAFLVVLTGCLGPVGLMESQSAVFLKSWDHATCTTYLEHAILQATGVFGVWATLLYAFCGKRGKLVMNALMCALCVTGLVNFLLFSQGGKRLTWTMEFARDLAYTPDQVALNLLVVALLAAGIIAACLRGPKVMAMLMSPVLLAGTLVMGACSAMQATSFAEAAAAAEANKSTDPLATMDAYANETAQANAARLIAQNADADSATSQASTANATTGSSADVSDQAAEAEAATNAAAPRFTLSRTGQNVVVIMLDRGLSTYFAHIMEELPQLKEQFRGFTFYENTVSFSNKTNVGSPCVYGGYEYTPQSAFERNHLTLAKKHNQAMRVMPVLFKNNGYDVTVLDPTYAGYSYVPNTRIYDRHQIPAYNAMDYHQDQTATELVDRNNRQNFFRYGLFRISAIPVQALLYGNGSWCRGNDFIYGREQTVEPNNLRAYGTKHQFMRGYNSLTHMTAMTNITPGGTGSFLMMSNDTTHEPAILQRPSYTPSYLVSNEEVAQAVPHVLTVDGQTIELESCKQESLYACNAASLLQLGQWFDYLREQGVWDNTRVIICADHGYDLEIQQHILDVDVASKYPNASGDTSRFIDIDAYRPLLVVKDFNADQPLATDQTFMTHADVPALATQGAIQNPVNPFTGNKIESKPEYKEEVHVFATHNWNPAVNNGYTYGTDGAWFSVSKDVRQTSNWQLIDPPYDPQLLATQGPKD